MIDLSFTILYGKKFWLLTESEEDLDEKSVFSISSNNHNFMLLRRDSVSMIKMLDGINKDKSNLKKKEGWIGNCDFCGFSNDLFIHSNKHVTLVSCYDCFTMITGYPNIKCYYRRRSMFIYFIMNNDIIQYQIVPTITLLNNNVVRNDHCQICFFNHQILDLLTCRICYKCRKYITTFKKIMASKFLILSNILNNDIAYEILLKLIHILYNTYLFIKEITIK